jgi:hypothetical protein
MTSESEMTDSGTISSENRAAVASATARIVNHAVEQRVEQVARAEQQRMLLERRVWRWAITATCGLVALAAGFAVLSRLHWL